LKLSIHLGHRKLFFYVFKKMKMKFFSTLSSPSQNDEKNSAII